MAATERKIPGTFAPVPCGYSPADRRKHGAFHPGFSVSRYDPSTGEVYGYAPDYDALRPPRPRRASHRPGEYSYCYEMQQAPRAATPPILPTMAALLSAPPCVTACPAPRARHYLRRRTGAPTWSRSAPMTKSRRSTKSSAKLALIDPQGRRITRRRCKPGHPARGGRSWK